MATLAALYNNNCEVLRPLSGLASLFCGIDIETEFLRRCGTLNTLYDDAEEFRSIFYAWVRSRERAWHKLRATLHFQYDPISNYDRTEEHDVSRSAESSDKSSGTSKGTSVEQVTGYNSNDFQNKGRNIGENSGSGTREGNTSSEYKGKFRAYGNIGVTTTQQMIEEERKVWKYNLIEVICEEYKHEFCILVY